MNLLLLVCTLVCVLCVFAADKNKPHHHQGELEPFDGHHIPYEITKEEAETLASGGHVTKIDRHGKSGRGTIIQDVAAPPHICMDRIRDLKNYSKMVANLRSIEIESENTDADGNTEILSKWTVGISLVSFSYFLKLNYHAAYNTYTWHLDYSKASDMDDNIGHWQALPHPTKGPEYSRVMYSSEVKLFNWMPEFVVTFLTKGALVSSTTWVKKESEKVVTSGKTIDGGPTVSPPFNSPDLSTCFKTDGDGNENYITDCAEKIAVKEEETTSEEGSSEEEL